MKTQNKTQKAWDVYNEGQKRWNEDGTGLEVFHIVSGSYDNACDTFGQKSEDSAEFAECMLSTMEGYMTSRETSDAAKEWFAARGIKG